MGMDLIPVNPSEEAPRWDAPGKSWHGKLIPGRYNWSGWSWLLQHLERWGVLTDEFQYTNDGDVISEETCIRVADAIEQHVSELDEPDDTKVWLMGHVILWRTCGGYEQR